MPDTETGVCHHCDAPLDGESHTPHCPQREMRTKTEIADRIEELEEEFDGTRFLTQEDVELIRGGKIQALKWVLGGDEDE